MDPSLQVPATQQGGNPSAPGVPLFRPEALAERQTQWLGTVLVAQRTSHRLFTIFAAIMATMILALLFFATYARKAPVSGWLVPEQGLVRVFAPQAGVATRFFVQEGDKVREGEPLVMVSTELRSATLGDTQATVVRGLLARRASLVNEEQQNRRLLAQQMAALSDRLAAVRSEQAQLTEEIALQEVRVRMAVKTEERQRDLKARGFISEQQVQTAAEARIEQEARRRTLLRNRDALQRDRLTLEGELRDLPLKFQAQSANIERNISSIGSELAEAEARREVVIPAPARGTVTAIQAETGGRTNASVPLLSIVPFDAVMEAHLYASSRAIGFVQAGQRVLLRYRAYPYQKFGHYEGVVRSISRSAISPGELPAQLAGLTGMIRAGESAPAEPVYRITVGLERQTVTAYGKPVPLQPGMQLDASIVIERRTLIEWLLDPLYTLTGR